MLKVSRGILIVLVNREPSFGGGKGQELTGIWRDYNNHHAVPTADAVAWQLRELGSMGSSIVTIFHIFYFSRLSV